MHTLNQSPMVVGRWKSLADLDLSVPLPDPQREIGPDWMGEGVEKMNAGEARHQMATGLP